MEGVSLRCPSPGRFLSWVHVCGMVVAGVELFLSGPGSYKKFIMHLETNKSELFWV